MPIFRESVPCVTLTTWLPTYSFQMAKCWRHRAAWSPGDAYFVLLTTPRWMLQALRQQGRKILTWTWYRDQLDPMERQSCLSQSALLMTDWSKKQGALKPFFISIMHALCTVSLVMQGVGVYASTQSVQVSFLFILHTCQVMWFFVCLFVCLCLSSLPPAEHLHLANSCEHRVPVYIMFQGGW